MKKSESDAPVLNAIRSELYDWQLWSGRALVLAFASLAGLVVVAFTLMTEWALEAFDHIHLSYWWAPFIWTPLCTAGIVWFTRRFFIGSSGSGIPQVMAAMDSSVSPENRGLYVSVKLSLAKMVLATWGLLAGLSLGREGPSVQIAAGIMHHARKYLPAKTGVSSQGLLMAGGAAGIAAAFNTPLGGIMFAIEELTRRPEQRSSGLLMAAIVLSGLMAVSVFGNSTYFGVIKVEKLSIGLLLPGLLVALCAGLAGGLFSRLILISLRGDSHDRFSIWRRRKPILFAAGCGLAIAFIGLVSHGGTYGTGYNHTKDMLSGVHETQPLYVLLKFIATWITAWAGVPGGLFAPALAIGGALGNDLASLTQYANPATLIALGMVGFLAAVTQAPLTSFIIVMEMVDGHALVLSLIACAMVASGVARLICVPLYSALAQLQLKRLPASHSTGAPVPATQASEQPNTPTPNIGEQNNKAG
jgi:H+/Cl- antiporter ClcA